MYTIPVRTVTVYNKMAESKGNISPSEKDISGGKIPQESIEQ